MSAAISPLEQMVVVLARDLAERLRRGDMCE